VDLVGTALERLLQAGFPRALLFAAAGSVTGDMTATVGTGFPLIPLPARRGALAYWELACVTGFM